MQRIFYAYVILILSVMTPGAAIAAGMGGTGAVKTISSSYGIDLSDSRCSGSLATCDALAVSSGSGLVCSTAISISSAVTVTSHFDAIPGCMLIKSGSGAINYVGPVTPVSFQTYSGFSAGDVTGILHPSPRMFGSTPGGENFAAFAAAIAAAKDGSVISCDTGTMQATRVIEIGGKSSLTIDGKGAVLQAQSGVAASWTGSGGRKAMLLVVNAPNFSLRNMTIDSNYATVTDLSSPSEYQLSGVWEAGSPNFEIEGVTFTHSFYHNLVLDQIGGSAKFSGSSFVNNADLTGTGLSANNFANIYTSLTTTDEIFFENTIVSNPSLTVYDSKAFYINGGVGHYQNTSMVNVQKGFDFRSGIHNVVTASVSTCNLPLLAGPTNLSPTVNVSGMVATGIRGLASDQSGVDLISGTVNITGSSFTGDGAVWNLIAIGQTSSAANLYVTISDTTLSTPGIYSVFINSSYMQKATLRNITYLNQKTYNVNLGNYGGTVLLESTTTTNKTATPGASSRVYYYLPNDVSVGNFTHQNDFSNAAWTASLMTVTTTTVPAPDGSTTTSKLTSIPSGTLAAATFVQVYQSGVSTSSPGPYTLSVYAQYGNAPYVGLGFYSTANEAVQWFDLSSGATATYQLVRGAMPIVNVTIQPVANGWYFLSATAIDSTSILPFFASQDSTSYTTVGHYNYLWAASFTKSTL